MEQCQFDILRFSDLLSKFTGISKSHIDKFLMDHTINNIFEHPTSLASNNAQLTRLLELKELRNLYGTLCQGENKNYIVNSSEKAGKYFLEYFRDTKDKERFVCAFLNSQNHIISTKVISMGSINEAPVYPREIVKESLMFDANSVILSHNHPGGSNLPSSADIDATDRIVQALHTVNIKVLDHIIVSGNQFFSMAEHGQINLSVVREEPAKYENIKESIPSTYVKLSDKSLFIIDDLNRQHGSTLSIDDIKELYKKSGKRLEENYNKADLDEFKKLSDVIDDMKQVQLKERQELAQQKTTELQHHNIEL